MKSFFSAWILMVLVFTLEVKAQDREPPAQANQFPSGPIERVETGNFMFKAVRAYPSGGGAGVDMTARSNTLKMKGDTATGRLAFFGTNTSAAFSSGYGGIEFDGIISNKRIKKNERKNQIVVSFSISGERDSYRCILNVSPSGPSTLNVSSNRKSPISYNGYIYLLPDK